MAIDDRSKESVAWSHRSNTMGVRPRARQQRSLTAGPRAALQRRGCEWGKDVLTGVRELEEHGPPRADGASSSSPDLMA